MTRTSFDIVPAGTVARETTLCLTHYLQLVLIIIVLDVFDVSVQNTLSSSLLINPVCTSIANSLSTLILTSGGVFDTWQVIDNIAAPPVTVNINMLGVALG